MLWYLQGGDEDYVSVPGCVDNQENIGEKGRKQRKNKQAAGKNRQKEEDESLEKLQRVRNGCGCFESA